MEFRSVNKILQESLVKNWDRPAVTNFQGATLAYRDVARREQELDLAVGIIVDAFDIAADRFLERNAPYAFPVLVVQAEV